VDGAEKREAPVTGARYLRWRSVIRTAAWGIERHWYVMLGRLAGHEVGCEMEMFSSRGCERGTFGCEIRHH
jgi:hypothetical protein